jgi:mRNA interferase MazF
VVKGSRTGPPFGRGSVWWAELREPSGSEPGFRRPVVIVSSDAFNGSAIRTVVAVVLTSDLRLTDASGNVPVRASEAGLPKDSVANVAQVITVDKTFLVERAGQLKARTIEQIGDGLRLALDL